jgi:hypothetical protein
LKSSKKRTSENLSEKRLKKLKRTGHLASASAVALSRHHDHDDPYSLYHYTPPSPRSFAAATTTQQLNTSARIITFFSLAL